MLARELADESFPTVPLDFDAADAARLLARRRLPGLVVLDDAGWPHSVLPGSRCCGSSSPATSRTIRCWPGCTTSGTPTR